MRKLILTLPAAGLLCLLPAAARATEATAADVQVRIPAAAVPSLPHEALRRAEIFRILQGGTSVTDAALAEHLWAVAGSLARSGWTPPRVTVRVVVKDADARD
jgi:hypothetical protein